MAGNNSSPRRRPIKRAVDLGVRLSCLGTCDAEALRFVGGEGGWKSLRLVHGDGRECDDRDDLKKTVVEGVSSSNNSILSYGWIYDDDNDDMKIISKGRGKQSRERNRLRI